MGRGSSGRGLAVSSRESIRSALAQVSNNTQSEHHAVVDQLRDSRYEDGTYDIVTMQQVEYGGGYQVTFWQIGDNYSDGEYADKVREFLGLSSDGRTMAGKFKGDPEISFHVNSVDEAIRLAKKYNQISVWDWAACNEIDTGGTGRRRK